MRSDERRVVNELPTEGRRRKGAGDDGASELGLKVERKTEMERPASNGLIKDSKSLTVESQGT